MQWEGSAAGTAVGGIEKLLERGTDFAEAFHGLGTARHVRAVMPDLLFGCLYVQSLVFYKV